MPASVRDRLLDAAEELFTRHGFGATGIDAIVARAGVAKMSLYKHFGSKDTLIAEVLNRADEQLRDALTADVRRRGSSAVDQLLAMFDTAAATAERSNFRPGLLLAAVIELDPDHAGRPAVDANHRWLADFCAQLASQAGTSHPETVGRQWVSLLSGSSLQAIIQRSVASFADAKHIGRTLLDQ